MILFCSCTVGFLIYCDKISLQSLDSLNAPFSSAVSFLHPHWVIPWAILHQDHHHSNISLTYPATSCHNSLQKNSLHFIDDVAGGRELERSCVFSLTTHVSLASNCLHLFPLDSPASSCFLLQICACFSFHCQRLHVVFTSWFRIWTFGTWFRKHIHLNDYEILDVSFRGHAVNNSNLSTVLFLLMHMLYFLGFKRWLDSRP